MDKVEAEPLEVRVIVHERGLPHRPDEVEPARPELRVVLLRGDHVDVDVGVLARRPGRERAAEERRQHDRLALARRPEPRDRGEAGLLWHDR